MGRHLIISLCMVFAASVGGFAYDTMELEKDFKEIIRLGERVYKSSIKASRAMSDVLAKDGVPTATISASQVSIVHQQLTSEDNGKIELQASNMQADNMAEMMPKQNNINTESLEKFLQLKKSGPAARTTDQKVAVPMTKRNDKSLVAKVFPDHNFISTILVSTDHVAANPAKLDSDSVRYRDLCVEMFNGLGKRGETAARLKFYELLIRKENLATRWYFAGIAAMVAGFSEYEKEQAVQNLKKILPDMHKESKLAVQAIDWDFAVAIELMPEAKASFSRSLEVQFKPGTISAISRSSSGKRGWWSGSSSSNKDKGKLSVNYWQETWNHMWGDMGSQFQSNFYKGTEYGQMAGEFIGMASGIKDAFGKMAAERTSYNIVQQIRDYAQDTIIGEMGLKPDPYSIVGHFAGGVIGTIGGSIGNAAGWLVGTMEAGAAQRGSTQSRTSGKKAGPAQVTNELIKLF